MKARYFRANGKWAKISGVLGRYVVAIGWKGDFVAIPGRNQTTDRQAHAIIIAREWVNDKG